MLSAILHCDSLYQLMLCHSESSRPRRRWSSSPPRRPPAACRGSWSSGRGEDGWSGQNIADTRTRKHEHPWEHATDNPLNTSNEMPLELTSMKIHGKMPLIIHWTIPVSIHCKRINPLENTNEHWQFVGPQGACAPARGAALREGRPGEAPASPRGLWEQIRPVRLLRVWISEGLTQVNS